MISRAIRYHYLDNLRALAMLIGVFYHAALAYSPFMGELWMAADPQNSLVLDFITWFTHLFRMPLFFLIAGFFAHHMVVRRGVAGFLKNRALRILLPFVIFLPISIVAMIAAAFYASEELGIQTPLLNFVVSLVKSNTGLPDRFTTMHLWFLFNLSLFCCVAALLFNYVRYDLSGHRFFQSPITLFLLFPLVLVPSRLCKIIPTPAPEQIYPELWSFGFFGVFFLWGWVYYKNEIWLELTARYWMPLLVFCVLGYAFYYTLIPKHAVLEDMLVLLDQSKAVSLQGLIGATVSAFLSTYGTFLCLLAGYKWLNKVNGVLRYIADSSYWVFIIHLPILFLIQIHLIDLHWPLLLKFLVGALGTIGIGIATYALFVRKTPIGWMLNGRR